jgi:quercetin dioxygenase-like cupin family protein
MNVSPNNAINLSGQIDFKPEKFASKVLFREENFDLILFALLQNQEIPLHQTPKNAFLQCLEGTVSVVIGDETHTLEPGQIIFLPRNVMHGIKASVPSKLLLSK